MSYQAHLRVSISLKSVLIFIATSLTEDRNLLIESLNAGKEYKTCMTCITFSPQFMGPNGIFESLITLKSTLLLILLDLPARDSISIF